MKDALAVIAAILIGIWGWWYLATKSADCKARGGTLAKGAFVYECVKRLDP